MPHVKDVVETTAGTTWYRAVDSMGREYVAKRGDGIQAYFGDGGKNAGKLWGTAKSHSPEAEYRRGHLSAEEAVQHGEFSEDMFLPAQEMEKGSFERVKAAQRNRWIGFKEDANTPDDPAEAFEEYQDMVKELRDADSPEERQGIRREYGIGGS